MLVGVASYQRITGDMQADTSGKVTDALLEAQDMMEQYLMRPGTLECGLRTEQLRVYPPYGRVYPNATPLIAITAPGGVVPDGYGVKASGGFFFAGIGIFGIDPTDNYPRSQVTYVGGWVGDDDYSGVLPDGFDVTPVRLPVKIRRAIAQIAHDRLVPSSAAIPGAMMVRIGDAQVQYRGAATADHVADSWLKTCKGYRRKIGDMRQ